jgi:hypothetical protein
VGGPLPLGTGRSWTRSAGPWALVRRDHGCRPCRQGDPRLLVPRRAAHRRAKAAIVERTGSRAGVPRDTQRRRRVEVEQIRSAARAEVPALSRDPLWVAGVCLYWGEGGKSARRLEMSNADPRLLLSFLKWIRRYHDPSCDVVLSLNLHAANDELEARAHWRRALGLPMAPFTKSFIKPEGTGHRKNHLAYGVCRVRLRKSADPWIRTMAWVDRLSAQLVASPEASLASNSGR